MIYLIFIAAVAAVAMGFSPVPVMVIGAVAVALSSFFMTRHPSVLRMGIVFAMLASARWMMKIVFEKVPLTDTSGVEFKLFEFATSECVIMAFSVLVMLISAAIAIFDIRGLEIPKGLPGDPSDQKI